MSIKTIPYEEATPAQKREFVRTFLNLDLPDDASDDMVAGAIERAQPGIKAIFAQEAPTLEEATAPIAGTTDQQPQQFSPDEQARIEKLNLRPEEQGRPLAGSLGKHDPRWLIEIPVLDTDDESGKIPVNVGVNGVAWELKRGVELSVPHRVVLALDNAMGTRVRHERVKGGDVFDIETVMTPSKRFAYQTIERPSEESIKRWHEETDALFCA